MIDNGAICIIYIPTFVECSYMYFIHYIYYISIFYVYFILIIYNNIVKVNMNKLMIDPKYLTPVSLNQTTLKTIRMHLVIPFDALRLL